MPTVQLARLQQETAELSTHFSNPTEFLRAVENVLEKYSVPVHRQGRVKGLRPVLFSYEVPPPVLKQLQLEMALQAELRPIEALAIADALWAHRTLETRILAVRLLGSVPVENPGLISQRLESWAEENREDLISSEFASQGMLSLRENFSDKLASFASHLLATKNLRLQILGLSCLQSLVNRNKFENLPLVFTQLTEVSHDPPKKLWPYLADLLAMLAQRSPKETVYFLQQRLTENPSQGMQWVTRQVLKILPKESAELVRTQLGSL